MIGKINGEKEKQGIRVQEYMNYLLTEDMEEYRSRDGEDAFQPAAGRECFS